MVVDKNYEIISFRPSKRLRNYKIFNTQKKIRLKMILKKIFTVYSITHFVEKQWQMFAVE